MKIHELSNNKLEREYEVTIPAKQIAEEIENKASELAKTVRLDGFREGKVPVSLVKQRYKDSILQNLLDTLINQTSQNIISENKLRLACRPDVNISPFEKGKDLEYRVKFALLPEISEINYSQCGIEELICDIDVEDVERALIDLQKSKKTFEKAKDNIAAKEGDDIVIDYVGYIDKKEFEGGKANDYRLELGSNQLIYGFELGLIGLKSGDSTKLDLTFPKDYNIKNLAGKKVVFEVSIKEVLKATLPTLDDAFARQFGMSNLAELKKTMRSNLEKRYAQLSYSLMKKELLDLLDLTVQCDLPTSVVEKEFLSIVKQLSSPNQSNADLEKELKIKYQKIAERRVKLGFLLSKIAEQNALTITQEDIQSAIMNYAQSMPGQEKVVIDYFNSNPQAFENLKGPIIEDKAVKFVLSKTINTTKHLTTKKLLDLVKKNEEKAVL